MRHAPVVLLVLLVQAPLSASPALPHRQPARLRVVAEDGHALALWEKRPQGRLAGVVVLVHGRTWSSLPDFDLVTPDGSASLMDALVEHGYAAYALDLRGYGGSPRDPSGFLTPTRAADDVHAALAQVAKTTGRKPVLFGWSRGAAVAELTAERHADAMSALILYGTPVDPDARRPSAPTPNTPERVATTAKDAASDFITPGSISPASIDAFVQAALRTDPVRTDWSHD